MSSDGPPIWHGLFAGAVSSIASRLVTFPADTVKARLQVQGAVAGSSYGSGLHYASTRQAFATIARTEGAAALYRGFGAVVAGTMPATAAYYGGYELGKRLLPKGDGLLGGPVVRDVAAGLVAQLVAGVAFTPVDVIKERIQVAPLLHAGGSSPCAVVAALLKARGGRGLLTGYWLTNCVWIPWNMIYISSYEAAKREATAILGTTDVASLPAWAVAASSFGAAAAAAAATHPADVIKTRLQVLTSSSGDALHAAEIARRLYRREGLRGFGSGLSARILTIAPGAAISWLCYEKVKVLLAG